MITRDIKKTKPNDTRFFCIIKIDQMRMRIKFHKFHSMIFLSDIWFIKYVALKGLGSTDNFRTYGINFINEMLNAGFMTLLVSCLSELAVPMDLPQRSCCPSEQQDTSN